MDRQWVCTKILAANQLYLKHQEKGCTLNRSCWLYLTRYASTSKGRQSTNVNPKLDPQCSVLKEACWSNHSASKRSHMLQSQFRCGSDNDKTLNSFYLSHRMKPEAVENCTLGHTEWELLAAGLYWISSAWSSSLKKLHLCKAPAARLHTTPGKMEHHKTRPKIVLHYLLPLQSPRTIPLNIFKVRNVDSLHQP